MSDGSMTDGEITITPPLKYGQFKDSRFNPGSSRSSREMSLEFDVVTEFEETETGKNTVISAMGLKPVNSGRGASGYLLANLNELIKAFPKHQFTGELTVYPEPEYEQFPYEIVATGRKAVKMKPVVTWVEDKDQSE